MKRIFLLLLPLLFNSCTITISQTLTDTHGVASDVVEEEQEATSDLDAKANLSVPATAL